MILGREQERSKAHRCEEEHHTRSLSRKLEQKVGVDDHEREEFGDLVSWGFILQTANSQQLVGGGLKILGKL